VLVALLIALFGELLLVLVLVFLLNTRIMPNVFADRATRYALALRPDFAATQNRDRVLATRLEMLLARGGIAN